MPSKLYEIRWKWRGLRWRLRHLHLLVLLFAVLVSVLFFFNVALGLVPFFTLGVDASTATSLLTVEGILLALSPQIKDRTIRTYSIAVTILALLYSVTIAMLLDFALTQNAVPSSQFILGMFRVKLSDLFALDITLFSVCADFYAVGAILS
jgi:hypothetical protein